MHRPIVTTARLQQPLPLTPGTARLHPPRLLAGHWPMGFGLGSHLLRTPGKELEGVAQKAGRGHSCHSEMLSSIMKMSAKPTLTKR